MAQPEVWLRGPIAGIPALLQPVAHSLLQSREEIAGAIAGLTTEQLWTRPGDAASVAFHARHAAGSLDRLFTYARGESLSEAQRQTLTTENLREDVSDPGARMIEHFSGVVDRALDQLRATSEATLTDPREVGRGRLPSTVIGLLFHAAEHTQRHLGQLAAIAKVVRAGN